jgi:hypothetical protein
MGGLADSEALQPRNDFLNEVRQLIEVIDEVDGQDVKDYLVERVQIANNVIVFVKDRPIRP